jgi:hypothetical protein
MNRDAKGSAYAVKAEKFYKGSEVALTRAIEEKYIKWDRGTVDERQVLLAGIALSTWPQPKGG